MKTRPFFFSVLKFSAIGTIVSVAYLCGWSSATSAQPAGAEKSEKTQPEKRAALNDGKDLNRLAEQEKAILGPDKQSSQKTIAALSAQVDVLQMQQDKLVEELLKYRRLAREAKGSDDVEPAFKDNGEEDGSIPPGEKPKTRREKELMLELRKEQNRYIKLEKELSQQSKVEERRTSAREEELKTELRDERDRGMRLEKELAEMKGSLERARENVTRAEGIEEQLREKDENLKRLESELERARKYQEENNALRADLERSKHQIEELEASVHDQAQLVGGIPALRKQLQEAKNELLMKQKEMQTLGKANPSSAAPVAAASKQPVNEAAQRQVLDEVMERYGRVAGEETVKGKRGTSDVMAVEVRATKVNLRAGPGEEHSPLMQVPKGTRLIVEQREGDWYRVIAPTGGRAYILVETVAPVMGDGGSSPNSRRPAKQVARAIPADDSFEPFGNVDKSPKDDADRAFQKLQKGPADPKVLERE